MYKVRLLESASYSHLEKEINSFLAEKLDDLCVLRDIKYQDIVASEGYDACVSALIIYEEIGR